MLFYELLELIEFFTPVVGITSFGTITILNNRHLAKNSVLFIFYPQQFHFLVPNREIVIFLELKVFNDSLTHSFNKITVEPICVF